MLSLFGLIVYSASGRVIKEAKGEPAFYALTYRGMVVDYFTSLQALLDAESECRSYIHELQKMDEDTEEIKIAV